MLLCITFSVSADYKEVSFIQASPDEVISTLNTTGQYSVVYFTADWCMPCQVLQESHFRDERIINLINNGFVSVKADYSETKDIEWYERYEVRMLPTLLVMDEHGNEVERIQNIRSTKQLDIFLHQYSRKASNTVQESKPMAYKLDEAYTPTTMAKANAEVVSVNQSSPKHPRARLVSNKSTEKNIYTVDIASYQSDVSIQFAAYTRYDNALKYLTELQQEGLSVSILEEYVKGKKYFKVVQRATKSNVTSLYHRYQTEGKECFIRPAKIRS